MLCRPSCLGGGGRASLGNIARHYLRTRAGGPKHRHLAQQSPLWVSLLSQSTPCLLGYHLSPEVTPFSIPKVLAPGGAVSRRRGFAKCCMPGRLCLRWDLSHRRKGEEIQQMGSVLGQQRVPLSPATQAGHYLSLSGPGLSISSDIPFCM